MKKVLRILRNLILFFFISTILTVVIYRFIPVYFTPLMVIRSTQQIFKGEKPVWHHSWVSFDKISPHLPMAVIASEDNRFATHNGFDFIEIKKAMKENETRKRKRGASTISQQTAGQSALIAATLPNPIRFDSAHPSAYILRRQSQILRLMKLVPKFPPVEKAEKK